MRDPIDRIVSHYVHRTVSWPDMGSLGDALADPHVREWLVTPSYYWLQLEPFLQQFPREQILVLDSDDLRANRHDTLARLFGFLGVDASFRASELERSHNAGAGRTRRTRTGELVSTVLQRMLGPARAQALRERAPDSLKAPFRYESGPPVLAETRRAELADELAPEVERLRAETGLAFAGWSL